MATLPTAAQLTGNVTEGQFKSGINQLLSYLSENVGANGSAGKQVMTASGVWTVPEGVTQVYISQCGGGGGGAAVFGCGGGGGASVYRQPVTVTPGESIACTIGSGGLGCTSAASSTTKYYSGATRSGSSGTATSFGSYITSAGGGGGISISGSTYSGGAAGGVGGSAGEYFHVGIFETTDNMVYLGGHGGSSMFGVGGSGGGAYLSQPETMTVGGDGIGYGAGGGGGTCVVTGSNGSGTWSRGGSGSNGVIIIEW